MCFQLVWCNLSLVNTSVFKLVQFVNKSVMSFVISPCIPCREWVERPRSCCTEKRNLQNRYSCKYENFKLIVANLHANHQFRPVNNRGLLNRRFVFSAGLCNVEVVITSVFKLFLYINQSVISFVISPCIPYQELGERLRSCCTEKEDLTKHIQLQIWKLQIDWS